MSARKARRKVSAKTDARGRPAKDSVKLQIRIPAKAQERFDKFFERHGESETQDRISVLLDLSESHPDATMLINNVNVRPTAAAAAVSFRRRSAPVIHGDEDSGGEEQRSLLKRRRSDPCCSGSGRSSTTQFAEAERECSSSSANDDVSDSEIIEEDETEGGGEWDGDDEISMGETNAEDEAEPFEMLAPNGKKVFQAPRLLSKGEFVNFLKSVLL
jgi:hypothetical protein